LVSDNVPFNSLSFYKFSKEWNFNCVFVSPRYPQSNGLAERCVGIVKEIFRKAFEEGKDHFVGLMEYRNTPIAGLNLSPAQLLFNRRLKTKLPISGALLNPEIYGDVRDRLRNRQLNQEYYYDRSAHVLGNFKEGDRVRIRDFRSGTWEPGRIVGLGKNPRSYRVLNESGRILVRNRKHLIPSQAKFSYKYDYEDFNFNQKTAAIIPKVPTDHPQTQHYVTRFGRTVKKPERYGQLS